MDERDKQAFGALLRDCGAVAGKNVTPELGALYWRLLVHLPIEAVRSGFDAHLSDPERGRFFPSPGDIIGRIKSAQSASDGHLGADEAWAICLESFDEMDTVAVTEEILAARAIAWNIYADGDRTGARMAFRDAYNRAVEQARSAGKVARWRMSLGHDQQRRIAGIEAAAMSGRITHDAGRSELARIGGDAGQTALRFPNQPQPTPAPRLVAAHGKAVDEAARNRQRIADLIANVLASDAEQRHGGDEAEESHDAA